MNNHLSIWELDSRAQHFRENFHEKLTTGDPSWNSVSMEEMLNRFPVMVAAMNKSDFIVIWNRQCEKITGFPAWEMIGTESVFEKLYPDHAYRDDLLSAWHSCNFEFSDCKTEIRCKNGNLKSISWSGLSGHHFPVSYFKSLLIGVNLTDKSPSVDINNLDFTHKQIQSKESSIVSPVIDENHESLEEHNRKIEFMVHELTETNRALSELASNLDKEREKVEKKMSRIIRYNILPVLDDIRDCKTMDEYRIKIDALSTHIKSLASDLLTEANTIFSLSSTESQIAAMIAAGMKSQEIADQLFISLNTVKTHRRNIRKKLKIQNTSINLDSFIKGKFRK